MTEPDDDTLASSEVRHRAVRGGIALIGRGTALRALGLLTNLVLARILVPQEFGELAIGLTVVALASLFVTGGLGSALVRRSTPPRRSELQGVLAVQLMLGGLIALVTAAVALPFGRTRRGDDDHDARAARDVDQDARGRPHRTALAVRPDRPLRGDRNSRLCGLRHRRRAGGLRRLRRRRRRPRACLHRLDRDAHRRPRGPALAPAALGRGAADPGIRGEVPGRLAHRRRPRPGAQHRHRCRRKPFGAGSVGARAAPPAGAVPDVRGSLAGLVPGRRADARRGRRRLGATEAHGGDAQRRGGHRARRVGRKLMGPRALRLRPTLGAGGLRRGAVLRRPPAERARLGRLIRLPLWARRRRSRPTGDRVQLDRHRGVLDLAGRRDRRGVGGRRRPVARGRR